MYAPGCMAISKVGPGFAKSMCCLQTHDTAYVCNNTFFALQEQIGKQFDSETTINLSDN